MKKIIRAGILSLTFVVAFMFTAALDAGAAAGRISPPADKGHVLTHGIQIQAKHNWNYEYFDEEYSLLHISTHDLTLSKGKSYTLKASLLPSGKSVSAAWTSSNPKIAKVSSSGKVTAVAPGTARITAYTEMYSGYFDETGYSSECYVIVPGGSKDAKPLGISDRTYSYGNTKFTAPTGMYKEEIAKIKKSIGGYEYSDGGGYRTGLIFGSRDIDKAHTFIHIDEAYDELYGFGFIARGKSPIKTSRGIMVGAKKSAVQKQYGLPTYSYQDTEAGKTYETFVYRIKAAGKNLYTDMRFICLKSKGTVSSMEFFLGSFSDD